MILSVIRVQTGTFNIIATEDDFFILQGNLTLDQLRELKRQLIEL